MPLTTSMSDLHYTGPFENDTADSEAYELESIELMKPEEYNLCSLLESEVKTLESPQVSVVPLIVSPPGRTCPSTALT